MWGGYLTGIGSVVLMSLPPDNLLLTHGHLCKQFSHLAAKVLGQISALVAVIQIPFQCSPKYPGFCPDGGLLFSAQTLFQDPDFCSNDQDLASCQQIYRHCLSASLSFEVSINQLLYSMYLLRYLLHSQLICDTLAFIYLPICLINMCSINI